MINSEAEKGDYVRKCDGEKACTALAWPTPDNATANAVCTDPVDPEANVTLPGDLCTNDTECFNGMYSNATCSGGTCKTTAEIGTNCTVGPDDSPDFGTRSCPAGSICNGTQCVKQSGKGDECDSFENCTTGYACLKITYPPEKETSTFMCTDYWSLDVGTIFDATYMTRGGFVLTQFDACSTHHSYSNDSDPNLHECRTPPKSNYTTEEELERPGGPADNCTYTTFDDPQSTTAGTETNDTAKCGFNKGGSAYCSKRKGDKWFQDAFDEVKTKSIGGLECHALSPLSTCGTAVSTIGEDTYKKWVKAILEVDDNFGYGLYADNDDCVKNSITNEFWQISSDSAFGSLTLSSFAAMILTISALFYMF